MRLVTFKNSQNQERVGIIGQDLNPNSSPDYIIDAVDAIEWLNTQTNTQPQKIEVFPTDMLSVIREQKNILPAFERILKAFQEKKLPQSLVINQVQVTLLAPIP